MSTADNATGAPGDDEKLDLDDDVTDDSSQLTNSSDELEEEVCWISWFISLKGNEFLCEIEEDYIQDDFNLTGLSVMVPFYDYALDMMLDIEIPTDKLTDDQLEIVETAAEVLYGLIHTRYILTIKGMARMRDKFAVADFGRCPRIFCQGQAVLPVGLSDIPRSCSVNTFCPRCHDIFHPKSARQANLDGAYFGTTFSHLFLMINSDAIPARLSSSYVPRIFGFRIHKSSLYWKNQDIDKGGNVTSSSSDRGNSSVSKGKGKAAAGNGSGSATGLPLPPDKEALRTAQAITAAAASLPAPPS